MRIGETETIVNNDLEDYDVYTFLWLSLSRHSVLVLFTTWILVLFITCICQYPVTENDNMSQ